MSEVIKPKFEHVPSRVAGLVHAHKTISVTIRTHAQEHHDARFKTRQAMQTQQNMMNAVKEGVGK